LPPFARRVRATRGDKGWWRLPTLSQEHAAPHGALHLGAINIVLEAAAVDAVSTLVGHDRVQVESWIVTMLRPGVVGPFRAEESRSPRLSAYPSSAPCTTKAATTASSRRQWRSTALSEVPR